jgi:hypothetical protein
MGDNGSDIQLSLVDIQNTFSLQGSNSMMAKKTTVEAYIS